MTTSAKQSSPQRWACRRHTSLSNSTVSFSDGIHVNRRSSKSCCTTRCVILCLGFRTITSSQVIPDRMVGRLRPTYYWPKMAADTLTTVRECSTRTKNRLRLIKEAKPIATISGKSTARHGGIYFLGPLPKSKSGYGLILFITDHCKKLTQAVPLRKIQAFDVAASFVDEWVF